MLFGLPVKPLSAVPHCLHFSSKELTEQQLQMALTDRGAVFQKLASTELNNKQLQVISFQLENNACFNDAIFTYLRQIFSL